MISLETLSKFTELTQQHTTENILGVADNTDIFKILEIGNMLPNYSKAKNLAPIVNNGKNIIFETSGSITYTYTTEFDCLIHITARASGTDAQIDLNILDENNNTIYWNEQQCRGTYVPIVLDFWAKKGTKFRLHGYKCNGSWNNDYSQTFVAIPLE
jgi:hypothetical protein